MTDMVTSDVKDCRQQLEKALTDDDTLLSSTTVDILERLKEIKMTQALLKATKVSWHPGKKQDARS